MYFNFTQSSYMQKIMWGRGLGARLCVIDIPDKSVLLIDCVYARYHAHMHVPLAVAFVFQSVLINLLQFLSFQFHYQSDYEPEQYIYRSPGHYSIYGEEEGPTIISWQGEQSDDTDCEDPSHYYSTTSHYKSPTPQSSTSRPPTSQSSGGSYYSPPPASLEEEEQQDEGSTSTTIYHTALVGEQEEDEGSTTTYHTALVGEQEEDEGSTTTYHTALVGEQEEEEEVRICVVNFMCLRRTLHVCKHHLRNISLVWEEQKTFSVYVTHCHGNHTCTHKYTHTCTHTT